MKFHLISDLHCDFSNYNEFIPECDYVVIAGDVAESAAHLQHIVMVHPNQKFIFVPGNHDFYRHSYDEAMRNFRDLEKTYLNLKVLQNQSLDLGDIVVFGGTMWSSLNAYPGTFGLMKSWCESSISDCAEMTGWSVDLMLDYHKDFMEALCDFAYCEENKDKKKVVISHFAPSLNSVHQRFASDIPFNAYWCNDYDSHVADVDYWFHGHVHNNFDYHIGKCRVVCNPRGYISLYHGNENPMFDPDLIIEV